MLNLTTSYGVRFSGARSYLDLEIPEEMKGDSDVMEGDASALVFPDGYFDVVVALDVLEHIPVQKRRDFLLHTTRVAGLATIIAAPFDNPQVRAAETDASAFWGGLMPTPCRWLAEHSELGLPDLSEIQAMLTELRLHHWSIGHGQLDLWRDMLKGKFSAEAMPELMPAMRASDAFYAKELLMQDFSDDVCYRCFLFCHRDAGLGVSLESHFRRLIQSSSSTGRIGTEGMRSVLRELQGWALRGSKRRSRCGVPPSNLTGLTSAG